MAKGSGRGINYDFVLTLSAVALMFLLSLLFIGSMLYFKMGGLDTAPPQVKTVFQDRMNALAAPMIAGIVVLVCVCVPNRLLPGGWLVRFTTILGAAGSAAWYLEGWRSALFIILGTAAALQFATTILLLSGKKLNFRCEGFWAKLGSCLVHLGLILFCLCILLLDKIGLSQGLFWTSAALILTGLAIPLALPTGRH